MSTLSATTTKLRGLSTPTAVLAATVAGAVAASVVNVLIAVVAHAVGASQSFMALQAPVFIAFTVVGTLAGVIGWAVIRARSARPAAILRWLVPTILLLSFIPDILVGVTSSLPGTSWIGVIGLMFMHVSVTIGAVLSCRRFLPLGSRGN